MVIAHRRQGSTPNQLMRLRVSDNGKYLVRKDGKPVFLNGESAWCLFVGMNLPLAEQFLASCCADGVNYLQTMLLSKIHVDEPNLFDATPPFTGADFATPNEAYFSFCDQILELAQKYGVYVQVYSQYLGSNTTDGWQGEVDTASEATMSGWGRYLGKRYRGFPNVVWGMSGDSDPTPRKAKVNAVAAGMREYDKVHFMSPRDEPNTFATTHWGDVSWVTLNGFYPYWGPAEYVPQRLYTMANQGFFTTPAMPHIMQEAWYEDDQPYGTPPTQQQIRQQIYYPVIAGAIAGQVFGNCPVYHFSRAGAWAPGPGCPTTASWTAALTSQGHESNRLAGNLFRSRYWWKLVPDVSQNLITGGYGTSGDGTYVVAASASDQSSIIAYCPSSAGHTLIVNSSVLAGSLVHSYWFNPVNGNVTDGGTATNASRSYIAPGAGDWVFVLDSDNFKNNFSAPGGAEPV